MRALFTLALLFAAPAHAQEVQEVITASADARDVARYGDRFFVATEGGLLVLRDDRVEQVLTAGLPGARLRSVSVVGDQLWVGAVEGTAVLDAELNVVATHDARRVRRAVDFGGHVWLASHGGGLFRVDGEELTPVSLGRAHAYVRLTDLAVVGDELWVASHGVGVLRVNADGRVVGRVRQRHGLPSDYTWRLETHGDSVFVATIAGVGVVASDGTVDASHPVTALAARLPVRDVRDVALHGETVWLATFGRGLYRADGDRPRRVGRFDRAHAALVDGDEALVAHAGGVHRVSGRSAGGRSATAITSGGLPSGDVTALARAFGTLWVGTFGDGLARMRGGQFEAATSAHERWTVDRRINDLAVTGRGAHERLWIATDRGLYWHDGRVFSRVEDPDGPSWIHTTAMHVDGGALWVTTSRELCRYRASRWRCWTGDPTFPVAQLHAVTTDRRGRVWVGSLHGLYRFDPDTERFTRHTVSSGDLPVDWVTAVVPWGDGVMAGTYHGGLAIGDGAGFRIVREGQAGLPSGWVNPHAIRRRGDRVYIGTLERGLVIGRPGAFTHLTRADGLPSDDVTDVLPDRGGVWVATRGGLARLR